MRNIFLTFVILFLSCTPALYVPSEKTLPAGTDVEKLKEGRFLYVEHCGSCHRLHLPDEYSVQSWKTKLDEMQKKAKISDGERNLIFDYLTTAHQSSGHAETGVDESKKIQSPKP
jgi:mono/diheme cytochrome c family protein